MVIGVFEIRTQFKRLVIDFEQLGINVELVLSDGVDLSGDMVPEHFHFPGSIDSELVNILL